MGARGIWNSAASGGDFPKAKPASASTSVEIAIEAVTALTAPISLVAAPEMIARVPYKTPAAKAKARPKTASPKSEWAPLSAPGDQNATATPTKPSARPKAASHVQRSRDPRRRPNRKTKMGWAPIISAISALVVSVAALPSSKKGISCPISASARSLAHSPGRDPGQTLPESALVSSIAAAATPTRARANARGSKAREAILISRKDEPQRNDRKASPAYAAMEFSRFERRELRGRARRRQRKFLPAGIASAMST